MLLRTPTHMFGGEVFIVGLMTLTVLETMFWIKQFVLIVA
jgi:hypothetical protein